MAYDESDIQVECDKSYNPNIEVLKYALQAVYLFPACAFNLFILYTMLYKNRSYYRNHSFFILFAADCFISFNVLLFQAIIGRSVMYIPYLCDILIPYVFKPRIVMKFYTLLISYCEIAKILTQILFVINRFTCIYKPFEHAAIWHRWLRISLIFVAIFPCFLIWNVAISRTFMIPFYGGMMLYYSRTVSWASQSIFNSILIIIALLITIICSIITIIIVINRPKRVKQAEKSLFFATLAISSGFIFTAIFQAQKFLTKFREFPNFRSSLFVVANSRKLRNDLRNSALRSSRSTVTTIGDDIHAIR
ncbi:unnamed protein product [Caenorhabditis bovis]|uniref:Serpentine receptor class gamma n=1 Tax=Caenorhabditis bovis TaxID=2654633 RepID=A0A8S1EVD2_9PELO|nr:unnamed protein product [Caenorhabditis bovis]